MSPSPWRRWAHRHRRPHGPLAPTHTGWRGRDAQALAVTIGTLAAYNVARGMWIPEGWHLLTNLLVAGAMALIAWWAGVDEDELGIHRRHTVAGVRWGGTTLGLIVAVTAVGGIVAQYIPSVAGFLVDDRVRVGVPRMLFEVLVNTPFGTVLLEELAFRGLLLALLLRHLKPVAATLWCSLLFGCWHIQPTLSTALENSGFAGTSSTPLGLTAVVALNVLATGSAGAAFCWLRLRSKSLLAPMFAHLGVNDAAFLVGWISNR